MHPQSVQQYPVLGQRTTSASLRDQCPCCQSMQQQPPRPQFSQDQPPHCQFICAMQSPNTDPHARKAEKRCGVSQLAERDARGSASWCCEVGFCMVPQSQIQRREFARSAREVERPRGGRCERLEMCAVTPRRASG
jgi:hypothetical protein